MRMRYKAGLVGLGMLSGLGYLLWPMVFPTTTPGGSLVTPQVPERFNRPLVREPHEIIDLSAAFAPLNQVLTPAELPTIILPVAGYEEVEAGEQVPFLPRAAD